MLSKNYASHGVKPYRPVQQPGGGYLEDTLTTSIKDAVNSYNKFLLIQVLQASVLENVWRLLAHLDQTQLTVHEAYQVFFTEHLVESDKK